MTTFNSKQQIHDATSSTTLYNQKQQFQQHHSNAWPVQDQPIGSRQQQASKQTPIASVTVSNTTVASDTRSSPDGNGALEQPDMTDDDDVEIIMHDSSNCDDISSDPDALIGTGTGCFIPPPSNYWQHQPFDSSPTGSKGTLLQRQLEYYFSRQNLINDTYLISQMDSELFVPIATIAKFKRVVNITSDMDFIISTLQRSSLVTVNDANTMVKPNIPTQRTSVILRDVPETTDKEIKQFLMDINSPPIKDLKKEYANMWYVIFDSEKDALKMLNDTRGKSFKGQQVAARMKFEPLIGIIQAQKSALQAAPSLSVSSANTTTSTHLGQNQHTTTGSNNKNNNNYSGYNDHHYYYNAYVNYGNQFPTSSMFQPSTTYYHHNANGYGKYNQRNGRYFGHNSNKHPAAKGGKKGDRSNKLINRNMTDGNARNHATGTPRHHWRSGPHIQQNQASHINGATSFDLESSFPDMDLSDKTSTVPLSVSSSPSQRTTISGQQSRNKSGKEYHHQGNETSSLCIQKLQHNRQHSSYIEPTELAFSTGLQNDSLCRLSQPSISSDTKTDQSSLSSTPSSRRGSVTKVTNDISISLSSSSSNSETVSTINTPISSLQSPSMETPSDIIESLEAQHTIQKRKPKWNKKKNKNSPPRSMDRKDDSHKVANQPDIKSNLSFPPLPINNKVSQIAASSYEEKFKTLAMSATHCISEKQHHASTVDIDKSDRPNQNVAASNDNASNHFHNHQSNNIVTAKDVMSSATIKQQHRQQILFGDDYNDSFPVLCHAQDTSRPLPGSSYADMLMKKD